MDTKQQPEALRLADELCEAIAEYPEPTALEAQAAAELLRQHAENETLRAGYAAARLEVESLKAQLHAAKQINAAQFRLLAASIPGSALRASHGQASSQAGEYPALVCDYCGALTPDPWHSSGMLHGKMSKHIHSCDACAARGATQASPVDANVQEDAARLDWLEQNLFHREKDEWDTKFGGYKEYNMWVLFSPKGIQGRARDIIDAARKKGETQ